MLFVISGKARVGKDTFGAILRDAIEDKYVLMAYADGLKEKCMKDFDLSRKQLYGSLKEVPDTRYVKIMSESDTVYWTPREIIQFIGTDCYRAINNDFWIELLLKRINNEQLSNVIITDARFPNEVKALKDLGAHHIHIMRDNAVKIHGSDHASETSLNDVQADFTVYNNKDFVNLFLEAAKIIKATKLELSSKLKSLKKEN